MPVLAALSSSSTRSGIRVHWKLFGASSLGFHGRSRFGSPTRVNHWGPCPKKNCTRCSAPCGSRRWFPAVSKLAPDRKEHADGLFEAVGVSGEITVKGVRYLVWFG